MRERSDDSDTAREYGPEWWVAGEVCTCEHHVDEHHHYNLGTPRYFVGGCMVSNCACSVFAALDNQRLRA